MQISNEQRVQLCELLYLPLLDMRRLGKGNKPEQAAALANAFHNLPTGMWRTDFGLEIFRDQFLKPVRPKNSGEVRWKIEP
jgi:hypothetical protein